MSSSLLVVNRGFLAHVASAVLVVALFGHAEFVRAGVTIEPPPISSIAGSYVGSVGGVTLQRLVFDERGQGKLLDVWFDSSGTHADVYTVVVRRSRGFAIELVAQPVSSAEASAFRAVGDADFHLVHLRVPETRRYRPRNLVLFREQSWQSMLDYARTLESTSPGEPHR